MKTSIPREKALAYLTDVANAFDPVEGPVEFEPDTWTRIRNAIYDLSQTAEKEVMLNRSESARSGHDSSTGAAHPPHAEDEKFDKQVLLTREQTTAKILDEFDSRIWKTTNDDCQLRLYSRYEVECVRATLSAREESPKEAFEEGMRIGRLGYRTVEEVIAGEELASSSRKIALDRARAWIKKTLYVGVSSEKDKP